MAASTRTFQSTHPLRGATPDVVRQKAKRLISIHAPLAGCDRRRRACVGQRRDFNPRTPCGVRLYGSVAPPPPASFQSTHPLRGATMDAEQLRRIWRISIHAPLAGCDSKLDEFLSANLRKSNKRDLLSEEKMRHGLPRTTCMSHFRSFFGCEAEAVFCPLALRT